MEQLPVLTPRQYQQDLIDLGSSTNVLITLPTGTHHSTTGYLPGVALPAATRATLLHPGASAAFGWTMHRGNFSCIRADQQCIGVGNAAGSGNGVLVLWYAGAGKTLIAAEIIRSKLPLLKAAGQVAVFLAPTNPLADQVCML